MGHFPIHLTETLYMLDSEASQSTLPLSSEASTTVGRRSAKRLVPGQTLTNNRGKKADEINAFSITKREFVYDFFTKNREASIQTALKALREKHKSGIDVAMLCAIRNGVIKGISKEELVKDPERVVTQRHPELVANPGNNKPGRNANLLKAVQPATQRRPLKKKKDGPRNRIISKESRLVSKPLHGTGLPRTMQETATNLVQQIRAFCPSGASLRIDVQADGTASLDVSYQQHIHRKI